MLDFASNEADLDDPPPDIVQGHVDRLVERDSFRGSLLIITHGRLF